MKNRIIVDSCCDMTPDMRREMGVTVIPLTMTVDGAEFRDDESLDIDEFRYKVKNSKGKVGSASPPPYLYQEAVECSENPFVITLSDKLSGSYGNAVLGSREAMENGGDAACVFDSKSASAGETLVAIKLYELIKSGTPTERIMEIVRRFVDGMKTYFVFDSYDNLQKNGRMSKVVGTLAHMLNIKLIMGADGNGEIALFEKCRGINKMVSRLIALIESSGKDTHGENLVITHCNNPGLAEQLSALIKERFHFKRVYIVPTGGLSSLYSDDKGIILAF